MEININGDGHGRIDPRQSPPKAASPGAEEFPSVPVGPLDRGVLSGEVATGTHRPLAEFLDLPHQAHHALAEILIDIDELHTNAVLESHLAAPRHSPECAEHRFADWKIQHDHRARIKLHPRVSEENAK
jgi:hypothetical protein